MVASFTAATSTPPSAGTDRVVSGVEFLVLLVALVALRFECRIYSYGALSTTIPRALGWIHKDPQEANPPEVVVAEEGSEFVKLRRKSWARLISRVYLEDPSLLRSCRKPMRIIAALTSPHQDEAIEKILRHRQLHRCAWHLGFAPALHDLPGHLGARMLHPGLLAPPDHRATAFSRPLSLGGPWRNFLSCWVAPGYG